MIDVDKCKQMLQTEILNEIPFLGNLRLSNACKYPLILVACLTNRLLCSFFVANMRLVIGISLSKEYLQNIVLSTHLLSRM